MSGQTLTDRIAAAQYQLTGSDMARAVCKATTHEVMAPKKKHLECKCGPHPHCTDCSFIGPRPYILHSHTRRPCQHYGLVHSVYLNGCAAGYSSHGDDPLCWPFVSSEDGGHPGRKKERLGRRNMYDFKVDWQTHLSFPSPAVSRPLSFTPCWNRL